MTKKTRIPCLTCFAAILFCLLPVAPVSAQIDRWGYWENGVSESWWFSTAEFNTAEADEAVARWHQIGAEKQSSSNQWAGDYFRGSEVHGTFVRWAPQGGFVMADIDKCQAKVMRVTYGRVKVTENAIDFIPEFRKGSQHHGSAHGQAEPLSTIRFVPVSWRGIFHLVSPAEISDFGYLAAGLGKYNLGLNPAGWIQYDFYYKLGSEESAAAGDLPVVPAGYEQFVREPIQATIESVLSRKVIRVRTEDDPYYESHSMVAITAGSASGVKRGMIFRVRDSEGDDTVEIIRVRRTSSVGRIVRVLDDNSNETYHDWNAKIGQDSPKPYPPIAVGWQVTTAPK